MKILIGDSTLELVQGDITQQRVDALVNAANARLAGGGGVDGAIHRAGGPAILEECRAIGGCPTGSAVATTAGRLPAVKVIHAVGPVYRDGRQGEPELLASAYRTSFNLAARLGLKSLAAPSISTGAYGYPLEDAAAIAIDTAFEHLREEGGLALIRFVLFGTEAYEVFSGILADRRPAAPPTP